MMLLPTLPNDVESLLTDKQTPGEGGYVHQKYTEKYYKKYKALDFCEPKPLIRV